MPIVMPLPKPCGLEPLVLPRVVEPNMPVDVLPRLAWARQAEPIESHASPATAIAAKLLRLDCGAINRSVWRIALLPTSHRHCRLSG
jgi:hypothetical protein